MELEDKAYPLQTERETKAMQIFFINTLHYSTNCVLL